MLLKNKNIVKLVLLLASSLTVMSGATIAPSLPKMSEVFANTPHADFLSKLVLTLPALMIALVSPLVGIIIDKFGRLQLLFISLIIYALGGTTGLYFSDLYSILAGRALLGVAVAGVMTSATTLIADYLEGEERDRFMGMQGAFMAFGGMVFVGSGGALADLNWRFPFALYFFSLVVLPLAYTYLIEPVKTVDKKIGQINSDQTVYPKFLIGFIYIITFLSMLLFYMIPVQLPFLLKSLHIEKSSLAGLAIVVSTMMGAVTSASYQQLKKRLSYMQIYAIAFGLLGIGFSLVSLAQGYVVILAGMVFSGLGMGLLMPNPSLWLMSLAPAKIRGRLIGGLTMAVFIGQFFSPIISEPIALRWSLSTAFGVGGLFMLILALGFILSNRNLMSRDKKWKQRLKKDRVMS
ncbi:MFS transporter [uncultured Microscilla sp.]|uniref:MFS transporter n=1 Tax=uncultured Microscilla sp. TaxID=432653 RepID=UPI0026146BD4|nr:MFS transporter [uncultured Microscilla sp.]